MAKILVDQDLLEDGLELICDSIRLKTGGTGLLAFPVEIKQAVDSIETGSGGITPSGKKEITSNGDNIDVTTYASVKVAVPVGITPAGTKSITANGSNIDVTEYAAVNVNVPQGITPSGKKEITSNGDNIDVTSYASVKVAVPVGITPTGSRQISENGTYDVTNYASAIVAVPTGTGTKGIKTDYLDELTVSRIQRSGDTSIMTVSLTGIDTSKVVGIVVCHRMGTTANSIVQSVTAMKGLTHTYAIVTGYNSNPDYTGDQYVVFSASDVVITLDGALQFDDAVNKYEAYPIYAE